MPVGSEGANVPHSLTCGFVTLMPTRTGKWSPNRSIGYMRTRRSASILEEYLMLNREHSPRWFYDNEWNGERIP